MILEIFPGIGQLHQNPASHGEKEKFRTTAVDGQSRMLQFPPGFLTDQVAGSKLQPGLVVTATPMFVRIAVGCLGSYLVGDTVQNDGPTEKVRIPSPCQKLSRA